ncbi:retinoblastoma-binding-like protein E [Schistocerca gregaria]|uniref:retinoblastoma-binding-like protein E n=1 Tax=Schistocerca gregaria TaxID=7010 RepID=UPI00211F0987|nr:retinoblastoma-binding-like protein E [Schistocerca gregaria]
MNIALLDLQTRNALPEYIEYELREDGLVRCVEFNRKGTLLAAGCNDGRTVIWDFETKGVAKILIGHVLPISSVSWSKNGKKLLTASLDWNVILWDLLNGTPDVKIQFESQVMKAVLHPRDPKWCLVSSWMECPYLVNLETLEKFQLVHDAWRADLPQDDICFDPKNTSIHTTAVFADNGDTIYTGDSLGFVCVIDTKLLTLRHSFRLPCGAAIKSLVFSKDKRRVLLNCSDRIIRVWDVATHTQLFELTDAVSKLQWKAVCFTSDGEYIVGGSALKREHKIYIWTNPLNGSGTIWRLLEGPKEGVLDLVWHPVQSVLISVSNAGVIYVWNAHLPERWGSFCPSFVDLKENEEYLEREDEFDLSNSSESEGTKKLETDSCSVDITTVDKINGSNSDEEDSFHLPVYIIPDSYAQPESSSASEHCQDQDKLALESLARKRKEKE